MAALTRDARSLPARDEPFFEVRLEPGPSTHDCCCMIRCHPSSRIYLYAIFTLSLCVPALIITPLPCATLSIMRSMALRFVTRRFAYQRRPRADYARRLQTLELRAMRPIFRKDRRGIFSPRHASSARPANFDRPEASRRNCAMRILSKNCRALSFQVNLIACVRQCSREMPSARNAA